MSGGLFGGYNKLQNALYSSIDEANAIRLEKAAREYSDYMKNAYRLMNDPNLREIAERRIGDTTIPAATRTASRETGEMNFGNVLKDKAGTVSAEQMYGVKLSQENRNESFDQWAAREDAEKKKAAEEAANHIKEQIRKNQELLNTKEVASRVNVPFESINEKRNIREWATDTLANSGYRALNPELGTVIFDKKRISGAVKYLKTPTEFAAFAALPDVIAKGSVLAMHEDHKGRNYGTYTIIAPIEINGQRGNMAVVVKKTSDNFYKVHRILAPDGKILDAFETKNTDTRNAGGYTENDGAHAQRMMSVSDKSIQQEANTVNSGNANNDIKTQSLEEYLGERELSSPVSDYNIDKTRIPHGETQRQRDARIKAGEKANNEYSEKRKAAIEEYNAKVERGEIKEPSQIAKTVNKAQGYLDNDSVAAARRMAEKRGYDWMSGEKLDPEKQVYTLSYLDENGKEHSETFALRAEAEERATALSESTDYDAKALVTATMPQSAAKVQQAETEEEARLRTLYESEPENGQKKAGAGESKAELDAKVKEAKESAVGDEELKEKPKTEKQKILKRRIEKAGLDMTAEEIVGFAQGLGKIKGIFGSEFKDSARIFDDVSDMP